ncbi:DUF190 domain-containing protein [Aquifex pyrophilus]
MKIVKKKLLRIFTSEDKKKEGKPYYKYVLERAKEKGLEGATVFRGIMGYGKGNLREESFFKLRSNLPIVIEIIDEEEKIRRFLEEVKEEELITLEDVEVIYL